MELEFLYSGDFGNVVIGNLVNYSTFCRACGEACVECRVGWSHADSITAAVSLPPPESLPHFLDTPESFLLDLIPADVLIAINIHPDVLLSLPKRLEELGVCALIVPAESPRELPVGVRQQLKDACEMHGVEYAFPKPFCALDPRDPVVSCFKTVRRFVEEFGVGKPELRISLKSGAISSAEVLRSAPCGSTWFVARKIIGFRAPTDADDAALRELFDAISKAHHSYPCTASMELDKELGDTVLHKAGYLIREAILKALNVEMPL
ncbi:DUF166 domain-containing protein [Candidatus Alkanophaga liquidiphilum]